MLRIGFIGAGKMAQALAKGFIQAGIVKGEAIVASCDPTDVSSKEAFQKFGAHICSDNRETATESDILFLAVKPPVVRTVLDDIKNSVNNGHLLISVAMGTSVQQIEANLSSGVRVVRVMPNTPALVRRGASVFSCGQHVTDEDKELTRRLLGAVGTCDQVPETYLDPITALSGSGPAYVYLVIESLADGGVRMGLPRDLAYRLASQTVLGAGHMVQETGMHPAILRENVTSPGGSTAEGLFCLEQNNLRAAIIGAIEVATKRCIQAKQSG